MHFLRDLLTLMDCHFANLLLRSHRGEKIFDVTILQTDSEGAANSVWCNVAGSQMLWEAEI